MPIAIDAHPLVIAQKLCEQLGRSGQYIWETSKSFENASERVDYLLMALKEVQRRGAEGPEKYTDPPVDIKTFVLCPRLLNMADEVYPKVLDEAREMMSGRYVEAILTGGIGTGKTTLALIATAYTLYELSLMKNPHQVFKIAKSSEIMFIFQSLKMDLSKGVDFERFKAMVDNSPYFQNEFRYDRSLASQMEFPKRIIVKPLTGDTTAALGQNVFGGVLDEVNDMAVIEGSKLSKDGGTFDQAREIYNSIARRRQSRFMQQGSLPGMLCMVSSKKYPGEFTDVKLAEVKRQKERVGKSNIFVYDKRVWDVKPEGSFSGEVFHVFVGDETRKPRILKDDEVMDVPEEDRPLVVKVPIEYYDTFEDDLLAAIRDVCGMTTMALHPYILNTEAVAEAFGKVPGIASRPDCDFVTTKVAVYPKMVTKRDQPRFVHIDLARTGDSAGFAMGHCCGFANIQRGEEVEIMPVIEMDMILEIKPPKGGEINFETIRTLIYNLRDKVHIPIKWVTLDSYQSTDTVQILAQRGFVTGYQSMDTDPNAYDVTKQAIYDGRLLMPKHEKAQIEFIRLERDAKTKKIDHPPKGSKDCTDAIAGVVYGLTMRREVWAAYGVSLTRIPTHLMMTENTGKGSVSYVERVRSKREATG